MSTDVARRGTTSGRDTTEFPSSGINSTVVDEYGMDSLIAEAVREHEYGGVAKPTIRGVDLRKGTGIYFRQTRVGKTEAEFVDEESGPLQWQRYELSDLQIRTQRCQVSHAITHEDKTRLNPDVIAQMGPGMGDSINRLEDITIIQAMSTTQRSVGDAGDIISVADLQDALTYISGGTGNPSMPPYSALARAEVYNDFVQEIGFQSLMQSELSEGESARVFTTGMINMIGGVRVLKDDYIPVDGQGDADMYVYARDAFIHVQGIQLEKWNYDLHDVDGGLTVMGCTYSFGVHSDVLHWAQTLFGDATLPS